MARLGNRVAASPSARRINPSEVHIWQASLEYPDVTIRELDAILSAEEKKRAQGFHFDRHRHSFIAGRAILRHLLSLYTGIRPAQIQFRYTRNGKPFLPGETGASGIHFNLSHSGGIAVYALTRGRQVGIDIERQNPMEDLDPIARRNFSAKENSTLESLPDQDRLEAFYLCWTRKEAFIKAIGEGISFPIQQFDVTLTPGEPAQLLAINGSPAQASRWSMHDLKIAHGYAAALVVEGSDCTLMQDRYEFSG